MGKLNYFNYSALAVLLILFITILFRGMLKGRRNRCFWYVLVVAIGSVLFDIMAVNLDNAGSTNKVLLYFAHSGYLILHNLSTPMFIVYLIELTGTWYKLKHHTVQMVLLACPFMTAFMFIFFSPITHHAYYLNENNVYTRGTWFPILYAGAAIYMIFGAIYLIYYRKLFERWAFVSSLFVFLAMPLAVVVQFIKPNLVVEMFAQALGVLLIMMLIQRPEERLDSLTGFNKYAAFVTDLSKAYYNRKPVHIILTQITNFKSLSDMLEYDDTNELIKMTASRIMEYTGLDSADIDSYYFGRGLFCVVIGPDKFRQTEQIAQGIHEAMSRDMYLKQMELNVMTQVCVIHCPEDIPDLQMLLSFCTEYESQHSVGSVLHASDIVNGRHYEIMHHMEAIIEDAIANRRFSVYYQPIYSVEEGKFHSAEALLRLQDEKYGFISPELFIPVAERNGAIHRIGAYVLEEVCKFISSEEFAELGLDYIEINLSVVQCMRRDLPQEVLQILDKYNVPPQRINLEITETAAAYAQSIMLENLHALADAGISLSLDDFGTGYSNMQRVASLPLYIVKLDRAFTNLEQTPKLEIVMRNTIRMIKDMNLKVVAEGIETADMVKQFSDLECEYIQGFYYSKPLPRDEFVSFVREKIGA